MAYPLVSPLGVTDLLHTSHPDAPPPEPGRASDHVADRETLRHLIRSFEREHGLETLLYVLEQVEESPTFRSFNLTLLEITYYVLSSHSPDELCAPAATKPTAAEGAGTAEAAPDGTANAAEAEDAEAGGESVAPVEEDDAAAEDVEAEGGGSRRNVTPKAGPVDEKAAAGGRERTGSGSRTAKPAGMLGSLMAARRSQRHGQLAARSLRHGNFGGAFTVNTAFGTQHVSYALTSSGDAELPQAARKRTAKAKMPMSAPIELRRDAEGEAVLRSFVDNLLKGVCSPSNLTLTLSPNPNPNPNSNPNPNPTSSKGCVAPLIPNPNPNPNSNPNPNLLKGVSLVPSRPSDLWSSAGPDPPTSGRQLDLILRPHGRPIHAPLALLALPRPCPPLLALARPCLRAHPGSPPTLHRPSTPSCPR